jgi:hypothetical protein
MLLANSTSAIGLAALRSTLPRRLMAAAMAGNTSTETTPAPTSAAALDGSITPSRRPISASAISSGMVVAVMNVISTRSRSGSSRA